MRRTLLRTVVALCAVVAGRDAFGQQVRGIVRDSASATPLPGAVVSILDSAGMTSARVIADGSGRFAVARPARAASLHVVRIGYSPRDVAIPTTESVTLEFAMRRLPAMLDAVRVSDREVCPGSSNRGAAFDLWEQARAGLLAAVVARETNPATATTVVYERETLPNDDLIRSQTMRTSSGHTTRPFVASAPAATFAKRGYMREDTGGRLFFAPDADVLLDETFAATHCFHLQAADTAHRNEIGIAFAPVAGRDTFVDVAGVVWMDRTTPALRSFDFRFTRIEPAAERAGVGGHLEFLNMPNGVSFVERWYIRLPALEPIPMNARDRPSGQILRRQDNIDVRVAKFHETGGQILAATWQDKTSWRDSSAGIAGTVTRQSTNDAVPFALVILEGTADTVTADARGQFAIAPLVPGRYSVVAVDTTMQAFVAPRSSSRRIDVPRGTVVPYQSQLEPMTSLIERACRGQKARTHTYGATAAIIGRLVLPTGAAARDAEIHASWVSDVTLGAGVGINHGGQDITADDRGRFMVCGVAMERPITLRATIGTRVADTTVVVYDSILKAVEWRLPPVVDRP
ncbi:MAG: carboxypeptidase regulatory-like domain-containing protein [bacterium]